MPNKHISGIYVIRQISTGRCYIGSSKAIHNRWYQHRQLLSQGRHHSAFLQNAWTKHGADAFEFLVLEECGVADLLLREQHHIDTTKPVFNINPLARSRLGSKQRPEVREKIAVHVRKRQNAKTHCPRGHEYTTENTYFGKKRGERRCRQCNADRVAKIIANETPGQRAARLQRGLDYHVANREARLAQQRDYTARTKDQKRAYDIAYRPIKNARRRAAA